MVAQEHLLHMCCSIDLINPACCIKSQFDDLNSELKKTYLALDNAVMRNKKPSGSSSNNGYNEVTHFCLEHLRSVQKTVFSTVSSGNDSVYAQFYNSDVLGTKPITDVTAAETAGRKVFFGEFCFQLRRKKYTKVENSEGVPDTNDTLEDTLIKG